MAGEDLCPGCGNSIGVPQAFHGTDSMTMHTHRQCPRCGRRLIWFKDGQGLPERWLFDEDWERREMHRQGR
jgi:DNA-directed RNA polymerase subunit RPC12/RpoP